MIVVDVNWSERGFDGIHCLRLFFDDNRWGEDNPVFHKSLVEAETKKFVGQKHKITIHGWAKVHKGDVIGYHGIASETLDLDMLRFAYFVRGEIDEYVIPRDKAGIEGAGDGK